MKGAHRSEGHTVQECPPSWGLVTKEGTECMTDEAPKRLHRLRKGQMTDTNAVQSERSSPSSNLRIQKGKDGGRKSEPDPTLYEVEVIVTLPHCRSVPNLDGHVPKGAPSLRNALLRKVWTSMERDRAGSGKRQSGTNKVRPWLDTDQRVTPVNSQSTAPGRIQRKEAWGEGGVGSPSSSPDSRAGPKKPTTRPMRKNQSVYALEPHKVYQKEYSSRKGTSMIHQRQDSANNMSSSEQIVTEETAAPKKLVTTTRRLSISAHGSSNETRQRRSSLTPRQRRISFKGHLGSEVIKGLGRGAVRNKGSSSTRFENERALDRLRHSILSTGPGECRFVDVAASSPRGIRESWGEAAGRGVDGRRSETPTSRQEDMQLWFMGRESKPLARFRQAVRTVQFLLKATLSSRQEGQRSEARLLSFAQYQDELEATNSAIYGTGLAFNPSEYKAIKEIKLSQETKAALRMEPEERTEEHLRLAVVNLQQAVKAFSEYPTNIKHSLVRVGWYEKYETKRVIIRQGHRAENFYFIISGTAVVTLLVVDPSSGESYVRTAAFLGKGNSFGEIGLMHGSQRSATVTCKEDVELLAVRREDFVDIFMHIESDQEPDHIRFLRGLDILDGWPVNKIPWDDPKICLFTYFRRGTVMCKDSSHAEWIYFFKTGSCRVLMALRSTKPQPLMGSQPPSRRESKQSTPRQSYEGTKLSRLTQALHAPPPNSKGGKAAGKGLPSVYRRKQYEEYEDTETDLDEGAEHRKMILNLYKEKHPHTKVAGDDPLVSAVERTLQPVVEDTPPPKPEMVFVELQKLGPKDTFGVAEAAFCGVMSSMAMSLVSDGAEAVLISRKFFMQHLSDEKRRQLRETVQPYPTEESLQQKLQDKTNWEAYKNSTIRQHVAYKQFVNDSLNW